MAAPPRLDDWPHHSDHLSNDDRIAKLTIGGIAAAFVVAWLVLFVLARA